MINKKLFRKLLLELDEELVRSGHSYEIVVTGAGALIALNKISRSTMDIDLVDPEIDSSLFKAAMAVAEKNGLEFGWLNSAAASFAGEFPSGWRTRTKEYIKGQNLKVKILGRTDLIFSKLHATAERLERDFDDLVALNPTKSELEKARDQLFKLKDSRLFQDRIQSSIDKALEVKGTRS